MMKIVFSLVCFMLSLSISTSSTNLACKYETTNYYKFGSLYHCNIVTALYITTQESAQIGAISGVHTALKTNDDVAGIYSNGKTIELFPRGFEKVFKNIKAITLGSSKIKEIYQEDLKPFPKLVYLYIPSSDIEVLEEGLFDFNLELQILGIEGTKVNHIDPNIFDKLTKLDHFWFQHVSCAATDYIYGSRTSVEEAIKNVKTRCISNEYLEHDANIKGLESEITILSSEEFKIKWEKFEKSFKNSKFSKFQPLKSRFEALKSSKIDNSDSSVSSDPKPNSDLEKCSSKPNSLSFMISELKDFTLDLKSSQCGLKDHLKDQIKESTTSSLNDITLKVNDIKSTSSQLLESQMSAFTYLKLSQTDLKEAISILPSNIIDSLIKNLKSSHDDARILQYEIKGSVSDMESSLSGLKTFQNDVKVALIKLKTTQNEIKISIDELKVGKSENSACGEKAGNLESLESQLGDIKAENAENFKNIQKELTNKLHKMSINFDEKVKGIESRIMKKIEEVLDEKLGKLLNAKL
ncbi:hypothetical protein ACKWTF_014463 [Chironomus riparius]